LWPDNHVGVKQLWEQFAQYVYLPRLRNVDVLLAAIADGPAQTTWVADGFAYAAAWDEESGRYRSLAAGHSVNVVLDDLAVVVKPEAAQRQLDAERAEKTPEGEEPAPPRGGERPDDGRPEPEPTKPTRFYGRVPLDPLRVSSQAAEIAEAIVQHLAGLMGANVKVTLEVEADVPEGAPDAVVRTVTENARTLKFEAHGFEQ
ncbi:MAG: AAA+ family ATPase, partial [bacterium]